MQLQEIEITRLFGHFDHRVPFPTRGDNETTPSLVIIHGPNGVGKTTVLQMLDGFMDLNFNVFRRVPFKRGSLRFTTGQEISVERSRLFPDRPLEVSFLGHSVLLHPDHTGAYREADQPLVDAFRSEFRRVTDPITFSFIETNRFPPKSTDPRFQAAWQAAGLPPPQAAPARPELSLAERVSRFVSDAQANSAQFFAFAEFSLFNRILQSITSPSMPEYSVDQMVAALETIRTRDQANIRYGLSPDPWDFDQLVSTLRSFVDQPGRGYALAVVSTYLDVLESRSKERDLVSQRLRTFEQVMDEFLLDKSVHIDSRQGLRIAMKENVSPEPELPIRYPDAATRKSSLREDQLSSGEYHLMYLMVTALVTRRRGTVIAIDEPEMSMHISWQRKLVRSLLKCASNASPQFIFATHSPDIVADYSDGLVDFGAAHSR
jgi:ABC-type lipoprotein export system ATPase subunit